jgi:cysteinyl-tRNA synthetase
LGGGGVLDKVRAAVDDDLSTPRALTAIDAAASDAGNEGARSQVLEAAALLGVQL